MDSAALSNRFQTLELAPFAVHSPAAILQSLVACGLVGQLMPDTQHAGLGIDCQLIEASKDCLLLRASIAPQTPPWQKALAIFKPGQHIVHLPCAELFACNDELLQCRFPETIWQMPRRALFRVAPPAAPPLRLKAHSPSGSSPWRGKAIDLSIGGLSFAIDAAQAPCQVDAILPACQLSDGNWSSPHFDLRVRSVEPGASKDSWRIGAALYYPERDIISSLQLASYRFEVANRAISRSASRSA